MELQFQSGEYLQYQEGRHHQSFAIYHFHWIQFLLLLPWPVFEGLLNRSSWQTLILSRHVYHQYAPVTIPHLSGHFQSGHLKVRSREEQPSYALFRQGPMLRLNVFVHHQSQEIRSGEILPSLSSAPPTCVSLHGIPLYHRFQGYAVTLQYHGVFSFLSNQYNLKAI